MTGWIGLGFDIDWAPDWCVALCGEVCRSKDIPATFFATHASDVLHDLASDPLFDVGIHPNFLAGSTHGRTHQAVLDHCLTLAPEASVMRTHGLYQTSHLFHLICDAYPQIEVDCSLFLPFARNLEPTYLYFGRNRRRLVRLPTFFEDDVAWYWPGCRWSTSLLDVPGLKIFSFHPIHVALNSSDSRAYDALKDSLDVALFETPRARIEAIASAGPGTRDFLDRLIDGIEPGSVLQLRDLAAKEPQTGIAP